MNFPTIVYRCPGDHHCSGGTYSYRAARDEEELSTLTDEGWFATLPEAINGEPNDDAEPTRAELEAKATELGIKFAKNTTDKILAEKIEFVLSEQEQ